MDITVNSTFTSAFINWTTSVTHNGRTFTVGLASDDSAVETFLYADQSIGILSDRGAVKITADVPSSVVSGVYDDDPPTAYTGRTIDGAIINPGNYAQTSPDGTLAENNFGTKQGWDSLEYPGGGGNVGFDATQEVSGSAQTMTAGSYVQCTSVLSPPTTLRSLIQTYSVLTVTAERPTAAEPMRPPISTTDSKLSPGPRSLVDSYIAGLTTRPSTAGWDMVLADALAAILVPEQVLHSNADRGRQLSATDRSAFFDTGYGRKYSRCIARLYASIQYSDYTLAQRQELAVGLCQIGIDLNGRQFSEGGEWVGNGALNNGRWFAAGFAATVMNSTDWKTNVDQFATVNAQPNVNRWHEAGQYLVVTSAHLTERSEVGGGATIVVRTGGTGYAVNDTFSAVGGHLISASAPTYVVTGVDAGVVTHVSIDAASGYYYAFPKVRDLDGYTATGMATTNIVGTGTGLFIAGRTASVHNQGMVGQAEWGSNPNARSAANPLNSSLNASYRNTNNVSGLEFGIIMHDHPTIATDMGGLQLLYDSMDRARWCDTTNETFTPWAVEEYDARRVWPDTVAPAVSSAEIDGKNMWVKFDMGLREILAQGPVVGDFAVKVNASPVTVNSVDGFFVWGTTVHFILDTAVTTGQTVTLDYTKGTSPLVLQNGNGDETATFTGQAITNIT